MSQENQERYKDFLRRYNATLPAEMVPEERKKILLKALQEAVAHDMASVVDQVSLQLDTDYNSLITEGEQLVQADQLAATRQALSQPAS